MAKDVVSARKNVKLDSLIFIKNEISVCGK